MIRQPLVMLVSSAVPAKTVLEFIAYAKANPGKVNMASSGIRSTNHLCGEMFKAMTGIDMIHIPYRADVFSDLIGGQVQVYFGAMAASIESMAVTTGTRSEALPDVPTVGEFVPGYEASTWGGLGAPKSTPTEIIDKLNREINAGLADPKLKARLVAPLPGASEFGVDFSKSCQRDLPQPRQLTAAFVPAAGEHSDNQFNTWPARAGNGVALSGVTKGARHEITTSRISASGSGRV
jgi:hypothetical protein